MSDTLSPTTLIMNYLRSKGLPPNAQNIRSVLTENARNPNLIPGLRNSEPETNNAASSVSKGGSVASKIEGSGKQSNLPVPPIPPAQQPNTATDAPKTTSAPPQQDSSNGLLWDTILGTGATGAAALAGSRVSGGQAEYVGNVPPQFTGRQIDVPGDAVTGPPTQPVIAADPMQAALAKATDSPIAGPPNAGALPAPAPALPAPAPQAIPMPDATSGAPIAMLGPPAPITNAPAPTPIIDGQPRTTIGANGPLNVQFSSVPHEPTPPARVGGGVSEAPLMQDFIQFIRGIGAHR